MDVIRDKRRVELEELKEDDEAPPKLIPYEEMQPYQREIKKPPKIDENTPQPEDIPTHTVYICTKPFVHVEEVIEPEVEEEEERSDDY